MKQVCDLKQKPDKTDVSDFIRLLLSEYGEPPLLAFPSYEKEKMEKEKKSEVASWNEPTESNILEDLASAADELRKDETLTVLAGTNDFWSER